MSERIKFVDGQPANLAAAALDAQDWLCLLYNHDLKIDAYTDKKDEAMERLKNCITALQDFLRPCMPEGEELPR